MDGKVLIYKSSKSGKSKNSGNHYRMVELHDPATLENVTCFLEEHSTVNTDGLSFKDKVKAKFEPVMQFGKLQLQLISLEKMA